MRVNINYMKETKMTQTYLLNKIANIHDNATGISYVEYDFEKTGEKLSNEAMIHLKTFPRNLQASPHQFHAELLKRGAKIPILYEDAKEMIKTAIKHDDVPSYNCLTTYGWQKGYKQYSTHDKIYGENPDNLLPPYLTYENKPYRFRISGNLVDWRRKIAQPLLQSTAGTICITAALLAYIIGRISLPSIIVNTHSDGKSGKSTLMLGAASVSGIGCGEESGLPNFDATESAMDEELPLFNHQLMPINEMSSISPNKAEIYKTIRTLTYGFAEGRRKRKNSKSVYASNANQSNFSFVALANGEKSIQQYATLAGQKINTGELARSIDTPIIAKGNTSVFDVAYNLADGETPIDDDGILTNIRIACKTNHGIAQKVFIEFLLSISQSELEEMWHKCRKEFDSELRLNDIPPYLRHCRLNFTALYLAGKLGARAGLLSQPSSRLPRILRKGYLDLLERHNTFSLSQTEYVINIFKGFIQSNRVVSKKASSNPNIAGYWAKSLSGWDYVLNAKALASQFKQKGDLIFLLKHLILKGYLKDNPNKPITDNAYEGITRQIRWANGTNDRCFLISLPRSFF
jgi:hypothetical protein